MLSKIIYQKYLIPILLFIGFFIVYVLNPNISVDDTVFYYFPAIWSFPRHFQDNVAFAVPYHILYGPAVWLANKMYGLITGRSALFISTAYWQSAFFAALGIVIFYRLLLELKKSNFISLFASIFIGFCYVYWAYARMFSSGAVIFFGTILGFYSVIYLINRKFSTKACLISGFLFCLAYLGSQTAILAVPALIIYANAVSSLKKTRWLGIIRFGVFSAIFLIPTLLLIYKVVWQYGDYNHLFIRLLGVGLGTGSDFKIAKSFNYIIETINNGTIAIFGLHHWTWLNTLVLYSILLLIIVKRRTDKFIKALLIYYLTLFFFSSIIIRDVFRYLKYWLLYLIPIICILFGGLNDLWLKINKDRKKRFLFLVGAGLLLLVIIRVDLTGEQYPRTWNYRDPRGVVPESEKVFYQFIIENTSEDTLILHDTEQYYANIVAFTQRYSRDLDYALNNRLFMNGDVIAPHDPKRPIFLFSAFDVSDIYIITDSIDEVFHFRFVKKPLGLFDGYSLNLYRFIGRKETSVLLDNKILSIYQKSFDIDKPQNIKNNENRYFPLLFEEEGDKKYLVIGPKNIVRSDSYYFLPPDIKFVSYPKRQID